MAALAEIDYQGDMTLETHVGEDGDGILQEKMIKLSLETAEYLIEIFRAEKEKRTAPGEPQRRSI